MNDNRLSLERRLIEIVAENGSVTEGLAALSQVLIVTAISVGMPKEATFTLMSNRWDKIEAKYKDLIDRVNPNR